VLQRHSLTIRSAHRIDASSSDLMTANPCDVCAPSDSFVATRVAGSGRPDRVDQSRGHRARDGTTPV